MSRRLKPLIELEGAQRDASNPNDLVWLSASAGTGKTHVLTARVLRLLLRGTRPESILCLTFTKAGAAEMADRVHARLAYWVRLDEKLLRADLYALGAHNDADAIAFARTLFARVLDAPGGGLTIQTIHAFCQTLLAGFPTEAGLAPGFKPLEGRGEAVLARRTLADLLEGAQGSGDLGLIADVQALSRRLGEGRAEAYLVRSARLPREMAALGPRQGIEARVRTALDVPLGDVEDAIVARLADDRFPVECLRCMARANASWGTKTGLDHADLLSAFLGASPAARADLLEDTLAVVLTGKGEPRKVSAKLAACDPDHEGNCARFAEAGLEILGLRNRAALAAVIAAGLRAGQAYAHAYADAKRIAGVVDFDDLIRGAVELLGREGIGEWVRYKLDRRIDHILVDEAQDTNAAQWAIVAALAGEFFVEEADPMRPMATRTIFTVGDFKQAIFGFQGTDPVNFANALRHFTIEAGQSGRAVNLLSLDRSFRSTPPVLALVDRIIGDMGPDAFGIPLVEPHLSARSALPGIVSLWKPIVSGAVEAESEDGEEGWIDDATRELAGRIAIQVRQWIADRMPMPGKGRPIRPEDVLILVRKRGALASLLVARLHAEKVPVAGVDRLRLDAPLAVKDLVASIRFALQPEDDLNLAALLVSPLFGLTQDELYAIAFRRPGSLWEAVRARGDAATVEGLSALLAQADLVEPYRFLETILSGPLDGRRKLMERLGPEARDPIEELLSVALGFEGEATPTLQRFLDWFDRGTVEVVRDPSAPLDAVRVMTVHGAKGLQAPLVILADATADPENSRPDMIDWAMGEGDPIPVPRPRKAEMAEQLAEAAAAASARERQEHWRLLYVAMTRAEEHLVIAGALGPKARGVPPPESWYARAEAALAGLGAEEEADALWGGARHYRGEGRAGGVARLPRAAREVAPIVEPLWLREPAPQESRPPRPLAPSSIGVDDVTDPPPSAAMIAAARRGELLHALFERLPPVAPDLRRAAADRWLAGAGRIDDADVRAGLVDAACAVIADPAHAHIFAPDALAEAPIAAVVGGEVVAGTVDRLVVTPDRITLIDFKTGRRVPETAERIPDYHLRQMAAYAAALAVIFPGRAIEAGLLYTSGPKLFTLPPERLKQYFPPKEQIDPGGR
ncbi:double-strand break repair helicase AddA [Sphingomonas naphthae]|uniref:DNA 3'-5' helicase n=1 Tax=Sphingomonas naphthae TaxID=1813468 RepID=A0ABY7TRK6_9SPHN|nr:double-strand break repair helicase AddA [Sphingomonas naphthae]WCT74834.1 double-strand break repair helicase AddA [Sphingomonas naphthae]